MRVWILYEETYSAWTPDFVETLEVFESEGLAKARMIDLQLQEAHQRLASIEREGDNPYEVARLRERREQVEKGEIPTRWIDVGMVAEQPGGVEVWQTRQLTVEEELVAIAAEITAKISERGRERNARRVKLRAQIAGKVPFGQGDWAIVALEVVGGG